MEMRPAFAYYMRARTRVCSEFDELASPSSPRRKIYNSLSPASCVHAPITLLFFCARRAVASPDASLPLAESIKFACPYATAFSGDNTLAQSQRMMIDARDKRSHFWEWEYVARALFHLAMMFEPCE
jgi:hypothetical protein